MSNSFVEQEKCERPVAESTPEPPKTYSWRACGKPKNGPAGVNRHLVKTGQTLSWCGFAVRTANEWKPNATKPDCNECLELEQKALASAAWLQVIMRRLGAEEVANSHE